jgi:hypothetical protein
VPRLRRWRLQLNLAGSQLGEVEHVVDQGQEVLAALAQAEA